MHAEHARGALGARAFAYSLTIVVAAVAAMTVAAPFASTLSSAGVQSAALDPAAARSGAAAPKAARTRAARAYGRLPLAFEPNRGQFDHRARFVARGAGYSLFLTHRTAVLALVAGHRGSRHAAVSLGFTGANPHAALSGTSALATKVNYLVGRDRSRWHTNIGTYARVHYTNLWRGIDAVFYGRQGHLEYDFNVAAGSDPGRIGLSLRGQRSVRIARDGALVLALTGGSVRQLRPHAYQVVDGVRRTVASRYVITDNTVRIRLGRYDHGRRLVIDPTLAYSTYLGGTNFDYGLGVAVDASGAAYVTGRTHSEDFPTTSGAYQTTSGGNDDVFVSKLSADGTSLTYSTYLGGAGNDSGNGIAIDASGAVYVAGYTDSPNFPTTIGAYQRTFGSIYDAFVTKLAPGGGSLVYSTYLGGADYDFANGIAIDPSGAAYVAGYTSSTDFPTTAGAYQTTLKGPDDAFVTKLAPGGGSLVYSTLLGGTSYDYGQGIAIDSSGDAYVTGETDSGDFPTTVGAYQTTFGGSSDAFVSKLTPGGGSLAYSTYLGGTGDDRGNGIAVDSSDAAYVTGSAGSSDFPTTGGAYQMALKGGSDVFVTKLAPGGGTLAYSTFIGGTSTDRGIGIAVNSSGNAYVTGESDSGDFPTTAGAYQSTFGGFSDAFMTKLGPGGDSLAYSTYLGGSDAEFANGIALGPSEAIYLAGQTFSTDFPTTPGAYQTTNHGIAAAFVAKFISRPPIVTTKPANDVTQNSATLNGTVNADGETTAYRFEYGTSTAYGSSIGAGSAGSDSSDQPESAPIGGLTPGTTYHFRIVATNSSGTSYGADQSFTTQVPPPAAQVPPQPPRTVSPSPPASVPQVETRRATNLKIHSATLHGSVNPRGSTTGYHFAYGTTTRYGHSTASRNAGASTATDARSFHITGLRPNTRYHFRIVATNTAGTVRGADRTFRTPKLPRLSLSVSPRQTQAGHRTCFAFTVTSRSRRVAGTRIALAGRLTRSSHRGTARICGTLRAGTHHARVIKRGYRSATATVTATAAPVAT